MHSRCGTQGARLECSNDEPGKRYVWEPDVPLAILEPDEEGVIAGRASLHKALHPSQALSDCAGRFRSAPIRHVLTRKRRHTQCGPDLKKTAGRIEDPVE